MQMKVAELVAEGFRCVTHGMIQNTVDSMQTNSRIRKPVMMHLHHQQTLQYLRQIKRNKVNRLILRQMVNAFQIYRFIGQILSERDKKITHIRIALVFFASLISIWIISKFESH